MVHLSFSCWLPVEGIVLEWNTKWRITISSVILYWIFNKGGMLGDRYWLEIFSKVEQRIYFRCQGIPCVRVEKGSCFSAITIMFLIKSDGTLNSNLHMNFSELRSFIVFDFISIFSTIYPTWNYVGKIGLIVTYYSRGCLWILLTKRESSSRVWAINWSNLANI